jgi:hypothetical protein
MTASYTRPGDNAVFWKTVSVQGLTLKAAVERWRAGEHVRVEDVCRGWNCNPGCPDDISLRMEDSKSDAIFLAAAFTTLALLGVGAVFDVALVAMRWLLVPPLVCGELNGVVSSSVDADMLAPVMPTSEKYALIVKKLSYCPARPAPKQTLLLSDINVSFRAKRLTGIMGEGNGGG